MAFFPIRYGLSIFVMALYAFLYAPMLILVIFSFNKIAFPYRWEGFSLHWYYELCASPEIWSALKNSLLVAVMSVVLSLCMALLLVYYSTFNKMARVLPVYYANLAVPEIILAVGLLSIFTSCAVPLGITTLIIGHTVLGLGYAVPLLVARYAELDPSLVEASLDLGATLHQTFYKIVIPSLMPAIGAAALFIFVASFDNFLLSFFCAGASATTLPIFIYSSIRAGVSPTINALSVLLLVLSSLSVVTLIWLRSRVRVF